MTRYTYDLGDGATYSILAQTETEAELRLEIDCGVRGLKLLERTPHVPEIHQDA